MRTVTSAEMRELDRRATEEFGIPGVILMENAGRAAADAAMPFLKDPRVDRVAVFCGSGNNGGDGLVCARYLFNRGIAVDVILMAPPERFQGDALLNYAMAVKLGLSFTRLSPAYSLAGYSLVIDALLGTGTKGDVRQEYRDAIELINRSNLPVISVDIPSGIDADTGETLGAAVKAAVTVTMALPKTGLLAPAAKDFTGALVTAEIGMPRALLEK